ncbi:single-stranded DNA-binding protein [Microbacterium sp. TNHR37B]|uniref:single-stranded DNA-binding protein n=1 Tax=Microbacterium sp. TNHR37B TaxID=1775956 RepID=UPI0007B19CA1|nr:single-stranded DNA-binding protein [Microbacterium sp. TNHR37B]KZE91031.1 Single-stranded DNA-binding protein [Microbacterium sp. TNHR37B]
MSEHITVIGTVVGDPERRQTAGGHTVARFRLASTERRRDEASGNWVDGHTNWFTISAYRSLAENVLQSLGKGQRVIVVGSFRLRQWESAGKQGTSAEIEASAVGHDLLWATTEYRRSESAPQTVTPVTGLRDDAAPSASPPDEHAYAGASDSPF